MSLTKKNNNSIFFDDTSNSTSTIPEANKDVHNVLLCDSQILHNYEKLKNWCHNQLNWRSLQEVVLEQLSNLWFKERYSLERLSKLDFIQIFKDYPYIKYYFLKKLNFNIESKSFTKNDITKNSIHSFIDFLWIQYLPDEEYKKKALNDLDELWIRTKEQFDRFKIIWNQRLLQSLWFRYILEKKFKISDFDQIKSDKSEISKYLFSENVEESHYVNELLVILESTNINNFTDLLCFIYLKTEDNNTQVLEELFSKLSDEYKKFFSSKWFNFPRIRWAADIEKLAIVAWFIPNGLNEYRWNLISKIKEQDDFLWSKKYDIDITQKLIVSEMRTNKYFNIYMHFFTLNWKWLFRHFWDDDILSKVCEIFWITQVKNIEDNELKKELLKIKNKDGFSQMWVKEFRKQYQDNPYVKEFFRRKCDLGWISRLTSPSLNKFLWFICN